MNETNILYGINVIVIAYLIIQSAYLIFMAIKLKRNVLKEMRDFIILEKRYIEYYLVLTAVGLLLLGLTI